MFSALNVEEKNKQHALCFPEDMQKEEPNPPLHFGHTLIPRSSTHLKSTMKLGLFPLFLLSLLLSPSLPFTFPNPQSPPMGGLRRSRSALRVSIDRSALLQNSGIEASGAKAQAGFELLKVSEYNRFVNVIFWTTVECGGKNAEHTQYSHLSSNRKMRFPRPFRCRKLR